MTSVDSTIAEFESELGVRTGFFQSLKNEDDWSFIIKCHALLESAMSHLIVATLKQPPLKDIVARLEMSGATTGKVAFAKALGLADDRERRFMRALSELRNDIVHDVRNVDFDLIAHMKSGAVDAKARTAQVLTFALLVDGPMEFTIEDQKSDWRDMFQANPKYFIWQSVRMYLGIAYIPRYLERFPTGTIGDILRDAGANAIAGLPTGGGPLGG